MSKHSIEIDIEYPDPKVEFRHYTKSSREGIQYFRSLPDYVVLEALRDWESNSHQYILDFMTEANGGGWTNPGWTMARLAEVAYHRNLITNAEFDRLTEWELIRCFVIGMAQTSALPHH